MLFKKGINPYNFRGSVMPESSPKCNKCGGLVFFSPVCWGCKKHERTYTSFLCENRANLKILRAIADTTETDTLLKCLAVVLRNKGYEEGERFDTQGGFYEDPHLKNRRIGRDIVAVMKKHFPKEEFKDDPASNL